MAHPDYAAFSIVMPAGGTSQDWAQFQELLELVQQETEQHIKKVAQELSISEVLAADLVYLRGRARWTPELEQRLVALHRDKGVLAPVSSGEEEACLQEHGY